MLDRARPIGRNETFDGTTALVSKRDGSPFPAEEASFVMGLYRDDRSCCAEYGRPEAEIATGTDNLIAIGNVLFWAFPPGTLQRLGPGRFVRILTCTLDGSTSERRWPLTVI